MTTANDWLNAAEALARKAQRPEESFEQAFARTVKSGAGRAFLEMHRAPQGRIATPIRVVQKDQSAETAEDTLHRLAMDRATADGGSYEQAMARILATDQGRALWIASRQAEGVDW